MTFKPTSPSKPDYYIPVTQCGFIINNEAKITGLQFLDPDGKQCLIAMPGRLLFALGESVGGLLAAHPQAREYKLPQQN